VWLDSSVSAWGPMEIWDFRFSRWWVCLLDCFDGQLWNPKVHCRFQNSSRLCHLLSQMSPVHILTSYVFNNPF
jgi:hypothetical protein